MNIRASLLAVSVAYLVVSGCNHIEYLPPEQNTAGAVLTVIQRGLSGTSSGFRFLGILPLAFPDVADAERQILAKAGVQPHDPRFVLVNKIKQTNTVYLFIASVHTLKMTADVAEISVPDRSSERQPQQ